MTLKSQIQSDVDTVFLSTSDFAEQVIRYVDGDTGNTSALTAVVTLELPSVDDKTGRGFMQTGSVMFSDSVTITPRDALQIRGERFEIKGVNLADFGAITVDVTRYIGDTRGAKVSRGY